MYVVITIEISLYGKKDKGIIAEQAHSSVEWVYVGEKSSIRLVLVRRVFTSSISNRAVKPRAADGTAVKGGRVGRCHLLIFRKASRLSFDERLALFVPCFTY